MAQYKKEAIKEAIDACALSVFARKGYKKTTVKNIADEAGISVGNVYHYYKKKDDIYHTLVTDTFIDEIKSVIKDKIGMKEEGERLYDFIIEHKALFLILFNGSEGTKYENAVNEVVETAAKHCYELYLQHKAEKKSLYLLRLLYRSHFAMIKELLLSSSDDLLDNLISIDTFHRAGMLAFI